MSLTPDMMPAWELREHLKQRDEEIARLRAEVEQYDRSFDLRWDADMRAIKRWQEAHPGNDHWPDHADLVVWLLERDAALRAENERLCPMCAPWQPMTREEADKMQADLVEQMKANAKEDLDGYLDTMRRLNAENERLRSALEDCIEILNDLNWITGAVERARAALEEKQ